VAISRYSAETTTKREGRSAVAGGSSAAAAAAAGKKPKGKSKKSKSRERTADKAETAKLDKALYAMIGKKISTEQVSIKNYVIVL
jgi:ribosomal protein S25